MRRHRPPAIRNLLDLSDPTQVRTVRRRLNLSVEELIQIVGRTGNSIAAISKEVDLQRAVRAASAPPVAVIAAVTVEEAASEESPRQQPEHFAESSDPPRYSGWALFRCAKTAMAMLQPKLEPGSSQATRRRPDEGAPGVTDRNDGGGPIRAERKWRGQSKRSVNAARSGGPTAHRTIAGISKNTSYAAWYESLASPIAR